MKEFFLEILFKFKGYILVLCLLAASIGATDGGIPFMIKFLFDKVLDSNLEFAAIFVSILIVLGFLRAFLNYLYISFSASVGNQAIVSMRKALFDIVLASDVNFVQRTGPSKLVSVIVNDTAFLKELIVDLIPALIKESLRLVVLVGASFFLNWKLSLILFLTVPIVVYSVQKISRKARKSASLAQVEIGKLTSMLVNVLLGFKTLKCFQLENSLKKLFSKLVESIKTFSRRADVAKSLSVPVNELLATVGISVVLWLGLSEIKEGNLSRGEFFAFLATLAILYDPIKKLSKIKSQIGASFGALERVATMYQSFRTTNSTISCYDQFISSFDIKIINLSFSYTKDLVFRNLNLVIPFGSKIAIMGPSGIGKSTLADVISGFARPINGEILIGGVSIFEVEWSALRRIITYVPQAPIFFEQLGIENFGEYANLDEARALLNEVGCGYLFDRLVQNENIGELASQLSGGEKQRLFIVSALIRPSMVYIFDEITSSLDRETEEAVLKLIFRRLKSKTVIFISHRDTIKRFVDQVISFETNNLLRIEDVKLSLD
ncbi:MAG: ABC transporter ATP-binding protein/permease [Deltaproteobacteria bacterium]|nr:ABC transporter ATP-binding protein/permease [Deltaproteobacteria bacterium]